MKRKSTKGPFFDRFLQLKDKQPIKIMNKNSVILPNYIDLNFKIYNGKKFIDLKIIDLMVGYRFGEFIETRKRPIHKKKK